MSYVKFVIVFTGNENVCLFYFYLVAIHFTYHKIQDILLLKKVVVRLRIDKDKVTPSKQILIRNVSKVLFFLNMFYFALVVEITTIISIQLCIISLMLNVYERTLLPWYQHALFLEYLINRTRKTCICILGCKEHIFGPLL